MKNKDRDEGNDEEIGRDKSHRRTARDRDASAHWHVERRSTVLICKNCDARIPLWKKPTSCPDCGAGGDGGGD
jgi:predicted amidophosphoribosyltransferase